MKKLTFLLISAIFLAGCGQATREKAGAKSSDIKAVDAKVVIYYFHGKQRCPTCIAVQKVTEEAVSQYFTDNPDVTYRDVDISEKENEALAEKYEVYFSSLVIASGEYYKNITDLAFANAVKNPGFLKELIVEVANGFMEDEFK